MSGIREERPVEVKRAADLTPPRFRFSWPSIPVLVLLAVLALFLVLLARRDQLANFLSLGNVQQLLHQAAVPAVVALGMLLIIISGGIDLSVGSSLALSGVAAMKAYLLVQARTGSPNLASLAAVSAGILTGGAVGLCNGLVITRCNVSPFVATLGMFSIARGLALWWTSKNPVVIVGNIPQWIVAMETPESKSLYFNQGVWSAFALAILIGFVLRNTVLGRHCYAIGSNEATARLCGVPVGRQKVVIYCLAGMLTGWAAVIQMAQIRSGDPNTGQQLELTVIAAVVIGGASLSGGRGTVIGTLLGVLLLSVLESGLIFLDVSLELKFIVVGTVVILNTALSRWQRRASA